MSEGAKLVTAALLLAGWMGAALLVVAVVAPAAFSVLPTRALAGAMVGRVLPVLFVAGTAVGLGAALLAWGGGAGSSLRGAAGLVMAGACAAAQFWIGGRIAALRARIGPSLDALPMDDPERLLFGRLHGMSVAALGVAALAALAALVLTLMALRARS